MISLGAILVAAGQSSRFGDKNYKKPFAPLAGRAVWLHSAERFLNRSDVKQVVVVIAAEDQEDFSRRFGANIAIMGIDVCHGGAERADSVESGLACLRPEIDLVAIHDAARPCVSDKSLSQVFTEAEKSGAAILASPVSATLKRIETGNPRRRILETLPREGVWAAATPQVFRRSLLEEAYQRRGDFKPSDDSLLVERLGHEVTVVPDSPWNLKITTRADLKLAEQILKATPPEKAKGTGHPFGDDDLWR